MKKILVLTSALALTACNEDYSRYDSFFVGCERLETTKVHLIYKCPSDQEWAQQAKRYLPNTKFKADTKLNLEELYADTAHLYLEVALNEKKFCKENFTIRAMIAKPVEGDNWAVIGCK